MAQFVVPRSIPILNFGPGIFGVTSGEAASHDSLGRNPRIAKTGGASRPEAPAAKPRLMIA